MYKIQYHKNAVKEIEKLKQINLDKKAKTLIDLLKENPFKNPPPYEKLKGYLNGLYSHRINIQHRLVYNVDENTKIIKILSLWSHYEGI